MQTIRDVLGDAAWTNILLAAHLAVVTRLFPVAKKLLKNTTALVAFFKIEPDAELAKQPGRARTEPGRE